jgi:hypothetical protein
MKLQAKLHALITENGFTKGEVEKAAKIPNGKLSKSGSKLPNYYFEEVWRIARYLSPRIGITIGKLLEYLGDDSIGLIIFPTLTPAEKQAAEKIQEDAWDRAMDQNRLDPLDHVATRKQATRDVRSPDSARKPKNKDIVRRD